MPLNEESRACLLEMASEGIKPIHESSPEEVRALTLALSNFYGTGPAMSRVENRQIPVSGDMTIGLRVLVPATTVRGLLLYYHGGGWVIGGNLDEFETLGRKLAQHTQCVVVLVNYRLAPEYRYPIAVEDSYAALLWASEHVVELTGAQVPLIVAGDSAGGNLAAVMAQRSRDMAGPSIALQVLVYPVTDANFETASYRNDENQLLVSRASMIWFWDHYLPDPDRRKERAASPMRALDLSDLPPAVVIAAEYDVLRDEGDGYAERLEAAGVTVDRYFHAGQMHGFFTILMLPGHEEAIEQISNAIALRLPAGSE